MKKRGVITLIIGAVLLISGIIIPLVCSGISSGNSTGELTIRDPQRWSLFLALAFIPTGFAISVTGLFAVIFPNFTENFCRVSTTLISIALSTSGALVIISLFNLYIYAVFNESKLHPVSYPVSFFAAILCFFACCVLVLLYYFSRRKNYSMQGIAIDLLTMGLYFVPMTLFWGSIEMVASELLAILT
ncbi:MAG: hypothetical protein E7633_03580 [Ruminococcaceae bacterium]|nr:hypothetical protein [Oscillospiraceae bacterium]